MKDSTTPDELAERLHAMAVRLLRTVRLADEATGITAPRLSALSVVVFNGSITLGKLAEAEQVRPPTMTRLVDALEELRLVTKKPDPADARAVRIAATSKGKRALLQGRARRLKLLSGQIGGIETGERAKLSVALSILEKMVKGLQ